MKERKEGRKCFPVICGNYDGPKGSARTPACIMDGSRRSASRVRPGRLTGRSMTGLLSACCQSKRCTPPAPSAPLRSLELLI